MQDNVPIVRVTVRPSGSEPIDFMDVSYELDGYTWQAGEELFRISHETVTIPFCPMEKLSVHDVTGEVALFEELEKAYPVIYRKWRVIRRTEGVVTITYRISPRIVPEDYRSSPYFDFRNENGGGNGAGVTFLAEIKGFDCCRMNFSWDLSGMPAGSSGVCSFGENAVKLEGKPSRLIHAYYAVGRLQSITDGDFGFYWLSKPPFDLQETADWTRRLFLDMAAFFRDDNSLYRIFVRKDPFERSGGGTALYRSYMFGYSNAMLPTLSGLKNLLAHEMVHNWARMKDEPYGEATWCAEGMAEYYSVMLPLRFGLATVEETLTQIQKRTEQYYTNPFRGLSNAEAAKLSWSDRRAQRIAYGRGFFFLANLDARIKKLTSGHHSLDEIAVRIAGRPEEDGASSEDFIRYVKELSGWDVTDEYLQMSDGVPFAPDPDSFDGLFDCYEIIDREADGHNNSCSWEWKQRKDGENYDI
jgi:hypothetical protein